MDFQLWDYNKAERFREKVMNGSEPETGVPASVNFPMARAVGASVPEEAEQPCSESRLSGPSHALPEKARVGGGGPST